MAKPAKQVGRSDGGHSSRDGVVEAVARVGTLPPDEFLQLRPELLNRVELRRVGREEEEGCASLLDGFQRASISMCCQVVHDDAVARLQVRHQLLFDEGTEDIGACARLDVHEPAKPVESDSAEHGDVFPSSVERFPKGFLSALRPAVARRRPEPQAGFIKKDQPLSCQRRLLGDERLAELVDAL